jgi:hypothetical protein
VPPPPPAPPPLETLCLPDAVEAGESEGEGELASDAVTPSEAVVAFVAKGEGVDEGE